MQTTNTTGTTNRKERRNKIGNRCYRHTSSKNTCWGWRSRTLILSRFVIYITSIIFLTKQYFERSFQSSLNNCAPCRGMYYSASESKENEPKQEGKRQVSYQRRIEGHSSIRLHLNVQLQFKKSIALHFNVQSLSVNI